METTSVRLPARLLEELDAAAVRHGVSRSVLLRKALEEHLGRARGSRRRGLVTLVDDLVNYPGSGVGDLAARSEEYLRRIFGGRSGRRSR